MSLQNVLTDILDRRAERRIESAEEEREVIALVRAGDSDALVTLLYAYGPALRSVLSTFRNAGGGTTDVYHDENARQAAVTGVIEAVRAFDPDRHQRLAAIVSKYVRHEVCESVDTSGIAIPYATRARFYAIMREANGDVLKAAQIAPEHSMRVETFIAVLSAVRSTSVDLTYSDDEDSEQALSALAAAAPMWAANDECHDLTDQVMVAMVFDHKGDQNDLTDREAAVLRHAYGFENYGEPQSDASVAHTLSLSTSAAFRARTAGLKKGRARLGA